MPTTIEIQHTMMTINPLALILFLILVSPFVIKVLNKRKNKSNSKATKKDNKPSLKPVPLSVKEKYARQLNIILKEYNENKRSEKDSYQLLSFMLREFFNEYAGIDVTSKTLAEIRGLNNERLERLVEEYYACEFAPDVKGNIERSINKTIQAIKNW